MRDLLARLFEMDALFDIAAFIWWVGIGVMALIGFFQLVVASVHSIRSK